jgi:hypothetical protein
LRGIGATDPSPYLGSSVVSPEVVEQARRGAGGSKPLAAEYPD